MNSFKTFVPFCVGVQLRWWNECSTIVKQFSVAPAHDTLSTSCDPGPFDPWWKSRTTYPWNRVSFGGRNFWALLLALLCSLKNTYLFLENRHLLNIFLLENIVRLELYFIIKKHSLLIEIHFLRWYDKGKKNLIKNKVFYSPRKNISIIMRLVFLVKKKQL